ncbi:hypothetical protein L210DRAFT_3388331 [Boletus edulis BED1]|uniref:Uncharacterized protein n=1 Tax=Boletus edulis BED1 TaxID=1328754 RepID=A0AAD4GKM7_BOLED|nr:hypothetical protein L210DRAFT_3388331 [Boletus edulis BED1]
MHPVTPHSANFQHLFEAQSRELCILQHERRALLEEKKGLTDAYAVLRQRYDERSTKLNAARHERQVALEQREEIDNAYAALKQQYDEQTKKLDAVRHERLAVLEQRQKIEENYAALWQKYEAQTNEYNSLNNKYHSTKATLEQRTSELQGVQRFLTTADTFSGSEVVNMLRKLNEEIQQCTTFMAEWVTRTLETLGTRFMQLLGTKKHKENPILMEMAFRAYLIYELYWVASPWSIGEEEQSHNVYIDAIHQRIQEAEGQAVSGNWRALTRTYTLPACISDPEVAHTFDTTIVSGFSDILVAAGCTAYKSDIASAIWSKFGEKVHHFVSLAGQVNKMIGVGVISEDFEVLVIWPDTLFNERTMEDAYDNGDRNRETQDREETVLCATELGLMQRIRVGAGTGQKGKPSELIVIKPKVALMSVIDIIE